MLPNELVNSLGKVLVNRERVPERDWLNVPLWIELRLQINICTISCILQDQLPSPFKWRIFSSLEFSKQSDSKSTIWWLRIIPTEQFPKIIWLWNPIIGSLFYFVIRERSSIQSEILRMLGSKVIFVSMDYCGLRSIHLNQC